jgi:hypothetical protein
MTPVWILVAVTLNAAPASQTSLLATAEDLVAQVRYADAEKALAAARAQPNNPRETLLRILELQGIVAATLGQAPKARSFFQALLTLDPARRLPEGQPPRVKTPFYEAKGMAAESAQMTFTTSSDSGADGTHLHAQLLADPLQLAKKVRFHQREEGTADWVVQTAPLVSGSATVVGGLGQLDWWAELLGEQDASLMFAGSADKPFIDGVMRNKPPPAAAEVVVAPPPPQPETPSRITAPVVVLFAGALAATGGGVVAGVLSRGANGQVDNAASSNGVVTGLTQRQADGLRSTAKTEAIAANVCFGAALALAGTGVVVFLLSGPSHVAVAPSPNGVVFAGDF